MGCPGHSYIGPLGGATAPPDSASGSPEVPADGAHSGAVHPGASAEASWIRLPEDMDSGHGQ